LVKVSVQRTMASMAARTASCLDGRQVLAALGQGVTEGAIHTAATSAEESGPGCELVSVHIRASIAGLESESSVVPAQTEEGDEDRE
jgi:hypothetical protein